MSHDRKRRSREKARKTISEIINCREDLITRLNELPAARCLAFVSRCSYLFEFREKREKPCVTPCPPTGKTYRLYHDSDLSRPESARPDLSI